MKKRITIKLLIINLLSSILLSLPFVIEHFGLVSLFSLIPLFVGEYYASKEKIKFYFPYYYLSFLIWNIITTFWIWYATPGGAVAAIILNSLQMSIIFRLYRWIKKRFNHSFALIAFSSLWLCWEHFYFTWQISWPWLVLGNSFASTTKLIQWYDTTGVLGGSLWVLLINSLAFCIIINRIENKKYSKQVIASSIALILPIIYSLITYSKYNKIEEDLPNKEVVALQPNIDPYNTKFFMGQDEQNTILLNLANQAITDTTYLIVAPETFFNPSKNAGVIAEDYPRNNKTVSLLIDFAKSNNVNILYGAITENKVIQRNKPNANSKKIGPDYWLNTYNSAVFTSSEGILKFYHKSKLVILAESVPIIGDKPIFESLGIDLGGGIGNFTPQEGRTVFKTKDATMFGSAICYESVFGDFYREYITNGANFMTIITNDGWWKNTPGHIQHLNYARLRAIETRRSIVRSANTGISAIINQRGDIVERTPWWKECYIRGNISLSDYITPFVKYGDIIGKVAFFVAILTILMRLLSPIISRIKDSQMAK